LGRRWVQFTSLRSEGHCMLLHTLTEFIALERQSNSLCDIRYAFPHLNSIGDTSQKESLIRYALTEHSSQISYSAQTRRGARKVDSGWPRACVRRRGCTRWGKAMHRACPLRFVWAALKGGLHTAAGARSMYTVSMVRRERRDQCAEDSGAAAAE
jgi:hypothetical protein